MSKTVLITGASSGFGRATARVFQAEGWNVIASMRKPSDGEELASLPNVLVTRLDVQAPDTIAEAIGKGIERFGRIDAVVNNAGYGSFGVFEAYSQEKIHEQFDVNLFGVMNVIRAILPHFRKNQSGTILNVSSGAGIFGMPALSVYCASKFALEGFSESLAYELRAQNITVKIIEPGAVPDSNFGQRLGTEVAHDPELTGYDAFMAATQPVYDEVRAAADSTSDDIGRAIYQAATDGTDQLRYLPTGDITHYVTARRQTSEAEYMAYMRARVQRLKIT